MQGNILIIEDEKEMVDLITLYLSREGFDVRAAESAEDSFAVIEGWKPELIILDINLPGMDGFTFLTQYRKSGDTPVLVISARDSDEDQINGLEMGADEYITKPFSLKVLVARVNALFRLFRGLSEKARRNILRFGPFTLDYDSCTLKKNGERIPLSTNEYNCLAWLSEHPGKPMPVESIYTGVWKNKYGDITTVAVYIQRLRKKIEEDPSNPVYIITVHGMGYQFNKIDTREQA